MTINKAILQDQGSHQGSGHDTSAAIIKLAVLAVGGQGGGVLTGWIAELAERAGYHSQMTSVAGVAQRTGATIYYVEMAPRTPEQIDNRSAEPTLPTTPVFALSPAPGDIDILIAAELMEAGRAVMRGFVTPDKTTLIASTHRILAVSEKIVPGDGTANKDTVLDSVRDAAWKSLCFDMQALADDNHSFISASLFGALAQSGALPFDKQLFEEIVADSGPRSQQSLAAFQAAVAVANTLQSDTQSSSNIDAAQANEPSSSTAPSATLSQPSGPDHLQQQWRKLCDRHESLPAPVQPMAMAGLQKTVDYQDIAYGEQYLDELEQVVKADNAGKRYALSTTAAKSIANALCYDDILRVADLKTRRSREHRLRREQYVNNQKIVHVTEYFHPRMQELCATLPPKVANWIDAHPRIYRLLDKLVNRGRRLRSDSIVGYTLLWLVAGVKPRRRKLQRHATEMKHLQNLMTMTLRECQQNYDLGIEVLKCQRLIKGYSDTHARGQTRFEIVTSTLEQIRFAPDAAAKLRNLRELALTGTGESEDTLQEAIEHTLEHAPDHTPDHPKSHPRSPPSSRHRSNPSGTGLTDSALSSQPDRPIIYLTSDNSSGSTEVNARLSVKHALSECALLDHLIEFRRTSFEVAEPNENLTAAELAKRAQAMLNLKTASENFIQQLDPVTADEQHILQQLNLEPLLSRDYWHSVFLDNKHPVQGKKGLDSLCSRVSQATKTLQIDPAGSEIPPTAQVYVDTVHNDSASPTAHSSSLTGHRSHHPDSPGASAAEGTANALPHEPPDADTEAEETSIFATASRPLPGVMAGLLTGASAVFLLALAVAAFGPELPATMQSWVTNGSAGYRVVMVLVLLTLTTSVFFLVTGLTRRGNAASVPALNVPAGAGLIELNASARRMIAGTVGPVLLGLGAGISLSAGFGTFGFSVLLGGLNQTFHVPFWISQTALTLCCFLAAWLWARVPLGLGSITTLLLIGPAVSIGASLPPEGLAFSGNILAFLAGLLLLAFGVALAAAAALGPDGVTALSLAAERKHQWPVPRATFLWEITAIAAGVILGGNFGIATVIGLFAVPFLLHLLIPPLRRFLHEEERTNQQEPDVENQAAESQAGESQSG